MNIIGNINNGYVLPIWFDDIYQCIEFLKSKSQKNYLYFFEIDDKYFKLGFSDNIIKRLNTHKSKLKDRIGKIGIIGNIAYAKYIENCYLGSFYEIPEFNDDTHVYDYETFLKPYDFKTTIEYATILITQRYRDNFNDCLHIGIKNMGFNIFLPNENDNPIAIANFISQSI